MVENIPLHGITFLSPPNVEILGVRPPPHAVDLIVVHGVVYKHPSPHDDSPPSIRGTPATSS